MNSSVDSGVLRLRDWSGLSCRPVYIYDRAYPVAGKSWEGLGASHNAAWLVRTGTVSVSTGRHEATARPGEWIIPPRGKHRSSFSPDAGILSVRFHAGWPDGRTLINLTRGLVLGRKGSRELTRLAKQLEQFAARNFTQADTGMEWKRADAVQYLALNRHFFAWLGELVGRLAEAGCPPTTPAQADERVLQATHLLNTLPLGEAWDPERLARQVGLSPVHLNRLFVAGLGTTPKAYHLQRRKNAAAHLLHEERLPVKQTALALGFSSACYFTAWFRTQFGAPPRRWLRGKDRETPGVR